MSTKTLNYLAPINPLGYGVTGLNLLLEFINQGVDVKLWPIGRVECSPDCQPLVQLAIDSRHDYQPSAPSLRVWHQFDLAQHVGSGKHVGFPIFELDKFTEDECHELRGMDVILVCSEWAKGIVLENCPEIPQFNVIVVPLGVDREFFHENVGVPDDRWTTFLNVGKWEYRKGHDIIWKAFEKAFNPQDRVRLWMMNHNPFISEEDDKAW